jgi:hypothetical protein
MAWTTDQTPCGTVPKWSLRHRGERGARKGPGGRVLHVSDVGAGDLYECLRAPSAAQTADVIRAPELGYRAEPRKHVVVLESSYIAVS